VTESALLSIRLHAPDPLQAPLHEANELLASGLSLRVTCVFWGKLAEQVEGQRIPAGTLVTMPAPETETVSRKNFPCRMELPDPHPVAARRTTVQRPAKTPSKKKRAETGMPTPRSYKGGYQMREREETVAGKPERCKKNPPAGTREGSGMVRRFYARTTFAAWKPLGPLSRSNSTVSPSLRVR